jgi:hypothetical protein
LGTSDGYAGSGGAWNGAQRELGDLLGGGGATVDDVCGEAAGALQWDAPDDQHDDNESADDDRPSSSGPSSPIPILGTGVGALRIARGGGRGSGGGGGAGGRLTTGAPRAGTGGRSRRRAARIGAGVAAAGYALRAGDAAVLRALGLDLAHLVGLSPTQQAKRIIDAVLGPAATIQEAEVARASSSMIIELLGREVAPSPVEVVRIFAVEYVYEILLTELGSRMRDGSRDGGGGVVAENDMHDLIEARVASLEIEGDSVEAAALESALGQVLEFTRRIIHERPAE